MKPTPAALCRCLTDGRAGHAAQALGLADAAGLRSLESRVPAHGWAIPPALARWLPSAPLSPPLSSAETALISCGRRAVAPALAARRARTPRPFSVHIHNPGVAPQAFDLVIAPAHERLTGDNVLTTLGALGRATPTTLARAAARWGPTLAALPRPWLTVLLGGPSRAFRMEPDDTAALGTRVADAARACGGTVLLISSRRTGAANATAFRRALGAVPTVFHDATVPEIAPGNPYLGWLGVADAILVTIDSISMISEACSAGTAVYALPVSPRCGGRAGKTQRFLGALEDAGRVRPFIGDIQFWRTAPLDETTSAAATIRRLMTARGLL